MTQEEFMAKSISNQEEILANQKIINDKLDTLTKDIEKRFWDDVWSSLVANGITAAGLEELIQGFGLNLFKR